MASATVAPEEAAAGAWWGQLPSLAAAAAAAASAARPLPVADDAEAGCVDVEGGSGGGGGGGGGGAGAASSAGSSELLRPKSARSGGWTKCYAVRRDATFLLFTEAGHRCLLAAVRVPAPAAAAAAATAAAAAAPSAGIGASADEGAASAAGAEFRISADPRFLEAHNAALGSSAAQASAAARYCAVLRRESSPPPAASAAAAAAPVYRMSLYSLACENCDGRLSKGLCARGARNELRQRLLDICQSSVHLSEAGVDVRTLAVCLPRVYDDLSRAVWCPRNRQGSGCGVSPRPQVPAATAAAAAATFRATVAAGGDAAAATAAAAAVAVAASTRDDVNDDVLVVGRRWRAPAPAAGAGTADAGARPHSAFGGAPPPVAVPGSPSQPPPSPRSSHGRWADGSSSSSTAEELQQQDGRARASSLPGCQPPYLPLPPGVYAGGASGRSSPSVLASAQTPVLPPSSQSSSPAAAAAGGDHVVRSLLAQLHVSAPVLPLVAKPPAFSAPGPALWAGLPPPHQAAAAARSATTGGALAGASAPTGIAKPATAAAATAAVPRQPLEVQLPAAMGGSGGASSSLSSADSPMPTSGTPLLAGSGPVVISAGAFALNAAPADIPSRAASRASSFSSADGGGVSMRGGRPVTDDTIELASRRPAWNAAAGTLMMRFMGQRVQASSSKNFLLDMPVGDAPPALLGDTPPTPPAGVPVLQFGKLKHGRWSVDLRHPLSVMQAFAIFLSAFQWLPLLDAAGEDEA